MSKSEHNEVFEVASGDVSVWIDGAIHLKLNTAAHAPIELGEREAVELGELLIRLAKQQRE